VISRPQLWQSSAAIRTSSFLSSVFLCHLTIDDCPVHVGQAEFAAGVTIRELLVVKAHEIEQGGVQVVDVYLVFDGLEAEVVGGAVDVASFKR
jgi:hypothetical protein